MDVRCEQCQTEYELEDSRVTEAGVTVKCTQCGHLFKVRRRSGAEPERQWLIRNHLGEIRRFKELTTLQQWIVERRVDRECEISRTGDTWKRLGEIAELTSFFLLIDQANQGGDARATLPTGKYRPPVGASPSLHPMTEDAPTVEMRRDDLIAQTGAWAQQGGDGIPQRLQEPDLTGPLKQSDPQFVNAGASLPASASAGPATGSWASQGAQSPLVAPARRGSTDDDTLRNLKHLPAQEEIDDGVNEDDPLDLEPELDSDADYVPRSRTPAVLAVLVLLLAGGGGALWYFKLRHGKPAAGPTPSVALAVPAAAVVDADAEVAALIPVPLASDAGAQASTSDAAAERSPIELAVARIDEDTDAAWNTSEIELRAMSVDPHTEALAKSGLALLEAARAQGRIDEAELLEADAELLHSAGKSGEASELKRDAKRKRAEAQQGLARAKVNATRALALAPEGGESALAQGEILLASKANGAALERALRPAVAANPADPRVELLRAMTLLQSAKVVEAEARLAALTTLPRALYRLAVLRARAGKTADSQATLETLLARSPSHARGLALKAQLSRLPVATPSPSPSAPAVAANPVASPAPSAATPGESGSKPGDSYAGLVSKGNKLAEGGRTDAALEAFKQALELRPSGVEAMSGMGYTFLDKRDYEGAIAYFEAALQGSRSYADAQLGLAEVYKVQGNKSAAIAAYRSYLASHPSGSKVGMALHNIQDLGGNDTPAPAPSPEAPNPTPAPAPPPPSPSP